jgi:hypothetical protein
MAARFALVFLIASVLSCRDTCNTHLAGRSPREAALRDDLFELRKGLDNF